MTIETRWISPPIWGISLNEKFSHIVNDLFEPDTSEQEILWKPFEAQIIKIRTQAHRNFQNGNVRKAAQKVLMLNEVGEPVPAEIDECCRMFVAKLSENEVHKMHAIAKTWAFRICRIK